MYARASYITAVGVVELPYLIAQTLVFVPISYFMIGARPCGPRRPPSHLVGLSCSIVFLLFAGRRGSWEDLYPDLHPNPASMVWEHVGVLQI